MFPSHARLFVALGGDNDNYIRNQRNKLYFENGEEQDELHGYNVKFYSDIAFKSDIRSL